jgi:phospholipase C
MPFTLQHVLVTQRLEPVRHESDQGIYFTVSAQGGFQVLYPGKLQKDVRASVRHSMRIEVPSTEPPPPPPGIDGGPTRPPRPIHPAPQPLHGGVQVTEEGIPLDLRLFDPDGRAFTRDEVTLADLKKFRDLRGSPRGRWRYTLSGQSRIYKPVAALNETVGEPKGAINLGLLETVASSSAPPLVARTKLDGSRLRATFDLNRVGSFVATLFASGPSVPWRGSMRLLDPDGGVVGRSTSRQLRCPIPLSALGKSRDGAGNPRLWTLEVSPQGGVVVGEQFVSATVLGDGRIGTAALQERIQKLIGPGGSFIKLVGENRDGEARAVMRITDVVAAETIDMHGLLDSRLKKENQPTDIEVDKPMVLYHTKADFDYGLAVDVSTIELKSIHVEVGPGRGLGADTPVLRLVIRMDGEVKVKWQGATLADAKLRDGRLAMEIGVRIDPDGTPRIVQWVPEDPFDIDLHNGVVAALVLALGVVGGVTAVGIAEYVEEIVNDRLAEGFAGLFDDPSLGPRILMTFFGTHLTYLPPRFEGADILFEHVAPLEPEPKPRANYAGAIGRTVMREAVGHATFMPRTLGNTWAADNLKSKIDHIVVVMMENRSYDHVLGYRALPPISDGADGLTSELMEAVNTAALATSPAPEPDGPPPMRPLRKAKFALNALNLRTRLPKGVGHELADVQQQLSGRIDGPGGRRINDPRGFIENFRDKKLGGNPEGADGVVPFDVLGYYEKGDALTDENTGLPVNDLPMYGFLAEQYAYCDRYYCSHPGPTLPNRMYSLTGDVQHDRLGVPILDNNHGDNFLLSRAPTIYDVLTRRGVSWRVYESNPSVTMLRMFARYATDDVNIRPLDELAGDVAAGGLPSLTVVEPAMHHHPEDDDHPHADMYRGQIFIRRVYEALRANPDTWRKTLLVITYDEHGGFYDHVIPPIADVLNAAAPTLVADEALVAGGMSDGASGGGATGGIGGVRARGFRVRPEVLSVLLGESGGIGATPADATIEIAYGVRVPTFVISAWTPPGKGPSVTLDHCSIVKTVLARFCGDEKPFLGDRVAASHSFEAFLSEAQPRMDVGAPPTLGQLPITARRLVPGATHIVTAPLFRKRMREEKVDFHELTGRLARMLGR